MSLSICRMANPFSHAYKLGKLLGFVLILLWAGIVTHIAIQCKDDVPSTQTSPYTHKTDMQVVIHYIICELYALMCYKTINL